MEKTRKGPHGHQVSEMFEKGLALRKEVLGSVKFVMLLMRFTQLFVSDYATTMFNNIRILGPDGHRKPKNER